MNWAWLVSLFLASTQSITRLGGGAALAQSKFLCNMSTLNMFKKYMKEKRISLLLMLLYAGVGPEPIDFRKYEDGVYRIKLCALWPRCLDFEGKYKN